MKTRLTKTLCSCGHPTCKRYTIDALGMFYQGSGFDPETADQIITALVKTYPEEYEDGRPISASA